MQSLLDFTFANDYYSYIVTANAPTPNQPQTELKRVSSDSLLGPKKELLIVHNGREYRLRLTQNGKLILTA